MILQRLLNCFIVLYIFFITSLFANQKHPASIEKYGQFEAIFTASESWSHPYRDVKLSAVFKGPQGESPEVEGFWYGDNQWKIRMMPTSVGHWQFTTLSNDSAMNGIEGEFTCVESNHPGLLMVNPEQPHTFMLSEGQPFFWFGETSWCMMSDAVPFDGTFQAYIKKRKLQRFNGIHFVLGTGGMPVGTSNPQNEGGFLWQVQNQKINPDFFKWMDQRMAYLDSMQMAVGFFITWAQHYEKFDLEDFERLERYLMARYAAYPLLYWVIVGEFDEAGLIQDYDAHGRLFHETDPYGHLVSNHPGHSDSLNIGTNRIFANDDWCAFVMQQFPQYPGHAEPMELYSAVKADRIYNKPVVNIEFGYENLEYAGRIFTSDDVRKYAWSVVCGGGFVSYGHAATIRTVDLDSTASTGALYMQYLRIFFESIDWWSLEPTPGCVDSGFCLANPGEEYVIYLLDSSQVEIDLPEVSGYFEAKWFNPSTGEKYTLKNIHSGGKIQLASPFRDDAVLHIKRIILTGIRGDSEKSKGKLPSSFEVQQNFPNPFANTTRFFYQLKNTAKVNIAIYDVLGRKISQLEDVVKDTGNYSIQWDGRDYSGKKVAAGIYFSRFDFVSSDRQRKTIIKKLLFN